MNFDKFTNQMNFELVTSLSKKLESKLALE